MAYARRRSYGSRSYSRSGRRSAAVGRSNRSRGRVGSARKRSAVKAPQTIKLVIETMPSSSVARPAAVPAPKPRRSRL